MRGGKIYLTKFPKGVWVRMEKYDGAPFTQLLQGQCSTLLPADTQHLVFIEPRASDPFVFREFTVIRIACLYHMRELSLQPLAKEERCATVSSLTVADKKVALIRKKMMTGGWTST